MFDQQHSPGERSECEGVRDTPLLRASCAYRLEHLLAHVWQSSQDSSKSLDRVSDVC